MKKYPLFLLIFFAFSFCSFAQKITKELSSSTIQEIEDGYLVYGFTKVAKQNTFHIIKYDKKLNEIATIEQPVEAERTWCEIHPYCFQFGFPYNLLGSKGAILKVDKNLKLLSFKEYSKEESSIARDIIRKHDLNNFIPINSIENYHGESDIEQGDYMIKMFKQNSISISFPPISNINKNAYKGSARLIGFKRKPTELWQTYSKEWEIDLSKYDNVKTYSFYSNNDIVYLYVSNWGKNNGEYLLSIDYKKGKIIFESKLDLANNNLNPTLSNLFFDSLNGSILLAGNYYDIEKIKALPKREQDQQQMHGYFLISLAKDGKVLHKNTFEFDEPRINESWTNRKYMRFQKITKNKKGNYDIIGENMITYSAVTSSYAMGQSGKYEHSSSRDDYYETYGFTFLEINSELTPVLSKFESVKWIKNNKLIDFDKNAPYNSTFQKLVYEQDIFGALLKREIMEYYKFLYQISNSNNTRILYSSGKNYISLTYDDDHYSHKLISDISIEENQPSIKFFEADSDSYYRFISSKNSFVFETVNY